MFNQKNLDNQLPKKLETFLEFCRKNQYANIGYPESALFDYHALAPFFQFSLNNCGDWSKPSNYKLNSFEFEKEVMQYFAQLYKIQTDKMWGYFTTGSTESNLFGCYLARERFPKSIFYYSDQSHYSIGKTLKILNVRAIKIPSTKSGVIDCESLEAYVRQNPDYTPVILANIGTTLTGAIDPLDSIHELLSKLGYQHGEYYIHADAALSGMILPFVENPQPFNFQDGIDSITVSGHKFIGSPFPYALVLTKKKHIKEIASSIEYIASDDMTISGSRNGLAPLMLWYSLYQTGTEHWKSLVSQCLKMADYAVNKFNKHNIPAWRHDNSITVVFPTPSETIWRRYGLAATKTLTHLIITPHHQNSHLIDQIVLDIINEQ